MPEPAISSMKLEPVLPAEFMAAAQASHRPASQAIRELMREFVRRQQERDDHAILLQRKVDAARASVNEGGVARTKRWKPTSPLVVPGFADGS